MPMDSRAAFWWIATALSSDYQALTQEVDAVRRLNQRIAAVRFTSVAFAARGQAGVKAAGIDEQRLSKLWEGSPARRLVRHLSGSKKDPSDG